MSSDLESLGTELRQAFADERRAIAALDHVRLAELAERKQQLAARLAAVAETASRAPATRELFAALRIEAHATAVLAIAASEAVRALLGYDTIGNYDHRAQRACHGPSRILVAY